ncbi:hypothetical protein PMAYCL1PPCAC_13022, partial [Pristionchus mayeri]
FRMPPVRSKSNCTTHFSGYFHVADTPSSSLFRSFKRQFLASVACAPGIIEVQSKTKSNERLTLDIDQLERQPFIRTNQKSVVVLRNRAFRVSKTDWVELCIRAASPKMAEDLRDSLIGEMWRHKAPITVTPPCGPSPAPFSACPSTPATHAKATALVMKKRASMGDTQNGSSLPLSSPTVSSTYRTGDDVPMANTDMFKIKISLNKENPSCSTAVIPSLRNLRPIPLVKEDNPMRPPSTPSAPLIAAHRSSSASSAARALHFGDTPRAKPGMQASPPPPPPDRAASPFHMDQLLEEAVQQPQSSGLGLVSASGASSPIINVMDTTCSSLNSPASSSMLGMQQLQLQPFSSPPPQTPPTLLQNIQALLQALQAAQMPSLASPMGTGMMGTMGSSPLPGLGTTFGGYGSGGIVLGGPPMVTFGNGDMEEYRRIKEKFDQMAGRTATLDGEKRRRVIELVNFITINCYHNT